MTYSGGNITLNHGNGPAFTTDPVTPVTPPNPNVTKYTGTGLASLTGTPPYNANPAAAALSGPITVTLTWIPKFAGQPPPQAICIDEQSIVSSAEVHGRPEQANDTHSENGFGDLAITTQNVSFNGTVYNNLTTSGGRHYRSLPSQADISILYGNDDRLDRPSLATTITWTVNVAAYADGYEKAFVKCEYVAQAHIVNIGTAGTQNISSTGERQLLVGQGIFPKIFAYKANDPVRLEPTVQHVRWTFDKKSGSIEAKEPFNHWSGSFLKFPQDHRVATSTDPLVSGST